MSVEIIGDAPELIPPRMTKRQAAAVAGVSLGSWAQRVANGSAPQAVVVIDGVHMWGRDEVLAWVTAQVLADARARIADLTPPESPT